MRTFTLSLLLFVAGCTSAAEPGPVWQPGVIYPPIHTAPRGLREVRGLVHAHSVYSHDACDDEPFIDGAPNAQCVKDFRAGLCATLHDFVMLTDHSAMFADHEFPDVLLYDQVRGDGLVERNGSAVASWLACDDDHAALVLAGCETSAGMPVGLEAHVALDPAARSSVYGARTAEAMATLQAQGAVTLIAHTEGATVDELVTLPVDGFEMYNLHRNLMANTEPMVDMLLRLAVDEMESLPHPDLSLAPILQEDPVYLDTWAQVLARGVRRSTVLGSDCHRNSLPALLADGERVDSYRRVMAWFSNHVRFVPEPGGAWDDRQLKDALRAGQLYGAFEVFGYPQGFDAYAETTTGSVEMGGEVQLAAQPTLVAVAPAVINLDPYVEPPVITVRWLLARDDGTWEEVRRGKGEIHHVPTQPGAYRAEVRILPLHLRDYLALYTEAVLAHDHPWIYANPIYIR